MLILFLSLEHLIFEFVQPVPLERAGNFEIRFSDFANARKENHALWAYTKAGPSGPGFLLIRYHLA